MSLSYVWLVFVFKIQVLSSSNPVCVLLIQFLSSFRHFSLSKLTEESGDKNESKFGFHVCHLDADGQILDIIWFHESPNFVHKLSKYHISPEMHVPQGINGLSSSGIASFSNLNSVFSSFKYLEYQSRAIGPLYFIMKFQAISSPHLGGAPATNAHFSENAANSKAAGEI